MLHRVKVAVYLRWLQWQLSRDRGGKEFIVINMDETNVSNLSSWKHGWALHRRTMRCEGKRTRPKPPRELKMTLMASVCNKEDWQPSLPQVLLPKHPGRSLPSKRLLQTWEGTGAPIQVWHGTDGWVNGDTMIRWLKCISSWVRGRDPQMDIVLIMDCFSVHTSKRTLQTCRRLNISVVLVPARMTWLLQCLDTDVFAPLKREMRRETTMREMATSTGQLRPVEHIDAIGVAIHHILVERTWAGHLHKVGAAQDLTRLRNSLKNMVRDVDLSPKIPTEAELQRALNLRGTQGNLLSRLLCTVPSAPNPNPAPAGPAKDSRNTGDTIQPETKIVQHVQIGGSSASTGITARTWTPEDYIPGAGHTPRARRLHLPAQNIIVKAEPEEIFGPAAGTRSRTKRSSSVLDLSEA